MKIINIITGLILMVLGAFYALFSHSTHISSGIGFGLSHTYHIAIGIILVIIGIVVIIIGIAMAHNIRTSLS